VLTHLEVHQAGLLHQRLALAIETTGVNDPEALALHWREAGDIDKALHFAEVAADKAARALAFDRAVRFYQLCIELSPAPPRDVWIRLADALANAGRGGDAGRTYLNAADGAAPGEALDLRRRAAEQLLRSGHVDEGLAVIATVLAAVDMKLPGSPRAALASLLMSRARVRMRGLGFQTRDPSALSQKTLSLIDICSAVSAGLGVVDTIRGADFQARQLLLALKAGEPTRVLRALAMETAFVGSQGTAAAKRAQRLLARAKEVAAGSGEPTGHGLTLWAAGSAAFLSGRWRDAAESFAEAEEVFTERCTGMTWELDTTRFFSLWSVFYLGDLLQLAKRAPALGRESEARGDLYAVTNLRTTFLPFLALVSGRPDQAYAEVDEALERWSRQGFHLQHLNGVCSHALADLYVGQPARAAARFDAMWSQAHRSLLLRVQQIRVRAVHLRACTHLASGRIDDVRRAIDDLEGEGAPWAKALALLLRAGVAERSGDPRAAATAYRDAGAALDRADMALYAAAARVGLHRIDPGDPAAELGGARWMTEHGVVEPARIAAVLAP
jgi:eukaryotic-like serine/threonine-protein kinase